MRRTMRVSINVSPSSRFGKGLLGALVVISAVLILVLVLFGLWLLFAACATLIVVLILWQALFDRRSIAQPTSRRSPVVPKDALTPPSIDHAPTETPKSEKRNHA
jgi:hypothetical protein